MLRMNYGSLPFGIWRRRSRQQLPLSVRSWLAAPAPPISYPHSYRLTELADRGVGAVLSDIHPQVRRDGSTLQIPAFRGDNDLRLDGRGLRLCSAFCWRAPCNISYHTAVLRAAGLITSQQFLNF
jgi:hypothetical protein